MLSPIDLGQFVKHARRKWGLTQKQVALTSGTGERFIVDLEKGKPTCEMGKVLNVLTTLGVKVTLSLPDEPGQQGA